MTAPSIPLPDPDLSLRVALTLLHFFWQGAVVAGAAALACSVLRRTSSLTRYGLLLGAMLVMALCPAVTFLLLRPTGLASRDSTDARPVASPAALTASIGAVPQAEPAAAAGSSETHGTATEAVPPSAPAIISTPVSSTTGALARWIDPERLKPLAPWMTLAYLCGALAMTARLVLALRGGQRLRRAAEPVTDPALLAALRRQVRRLGLRREPLIGWCRQVAAPSVVGVLRPAILLPVALSSGMSASQVESILAHELAHVRRLDPLANAVQGLIEALLFFHPAVWFVSRRVRVERENCCDDLVLSAGSAPLDYVKSLVRAAELGLFGNDAPPVGTAALAAVGHPSHLRQRIVRLLQGEPAPQLRVSPGPILALVLLASVACGGAWYRVVQGQGTDEGATPASTFSGRLVDAQGRPLSNGYIYPEGTFLKRESVRSDKDGVFVLKDVQPDQKNWVVWSQRISRRTAFTVPPKAPPQPMPVRVDYWDAAVEGRVVDPAGNPVSNVPVWAFTTFPDKTVHRFPAYAKTGEDGYYSVGAVPSGPGLTLRVGLSDDPTAGPATPPVPMANQFQYELPDLTAKEAVAAPAKPIPPRVRFGGRVVDEAGKPVAGAHVEMSYPKNQMVSRAGTVITDAEGKFSRLMPPEADRVTFRLNAPEHQSYHFDERPQPAPVEALRAGTAVLVMKSGLPVSGVVKDAAGKPVENALVLAGRYYSTTPGPENEPIEDFTSCRTTRDGSFRIGGLPVGWRELFVGADGYAPTVTTVEINPGAAPAELKLDKGITYSARVVDGEGKPVAGTRVGIDEWVIGGQQRRSISRVVTTGEDGRFTFNNLPTVGRLEMTTGGKKFLSTSFNWSAEGKNPETISVYEPPVVRGRVVDAQTGQPVAGARAAPMWGDPPHGLSMNGATDARGDGSFELSIKYVIVHAPDYTPFAAKVTAPGYFAQVTPLVRLGKPYEPFVVKLEKGEPLVGNVSDGDGKPAAGATVAFVEPANKAWVTGLKINDDLVAAPDTVVKTDASSRFELPPTKAQGRVLVLHEKGYSVLPYPGLAPGQQVTLIPWARVEGVVRKDGKPVHRAQVYLAPAGNQGLLGDNIQFMLRSVTHTDGKFVIEKVPSTAWKVMEGQEDKGVQVVPTPGETSTVEVGGGAKPGVS